MSASSVEKAPYDPRPETATGRVIRVLREKPAGTKMLTRDLSLLAAVSKGSFANQMATALREGILKCELAGPRRALWFLPFTPYENAFEQSGNSLDLDAIEAASRVEKREPRPRIGPAPITGLSWISSNPVVYVADEPEAEPEPESTRIEFVGEEPDEDCGSEPEELEADSSAFVSDEQDPEDVLPTGPHLSLRSVGDAHGENFNRHRRVEDMLSDPCVPEWRKQLLRLKGTERQNALVRKFRDLLGSSDALYTGDPLEAINKMLIMARKVSDARASSAFKGVEVDLLVSREIRQVAEAAERATDNLALALKTMLGQV